MKILLIEDDEFKEVAISQKLLDMGFDKPKSVEKSVQASIENIQLHDYDLILLDMSLPSHDLIQGKGSPVPMPSGGMEVIMELNYIERQDKVIILTQYPEIEIDHTLYDLEKAKDKIIDDYNVNLLRIIRFKRLKNNWKRDLNDEMEKLR